MFHFFSSNGIGSFSTINYKYGDFRCIRENNRVSCSFSSIRYGSKDSNVYFIKDYYGEYPLTGMIKAEKSYVNQTLLSEKYFEYKITEINNSNLVGGKKIFQVDVSSDKQLNYDMKSGALLKTESHDFKYDVLGNIVKLTENLSSLKLNFTKITKSQFNYTESNLNDWYLNQLIEKQETFIQKHENNQIESKSLQYIFTYDSKKRFLLKKTKLPTETYGLEQSYTYDEYGNVIKVNSKDLGTLEIRSKLYTYDTNGINIIKETNELNHSKSYYYDLNDNILHLVYSNGYNTSFKYNQLGKKIQQDQSGSSSELISFNWDDSIPNAVYSIKNSIKGGRFSL
jgi:hypothetical protein